MFAAVNCTGQLELNRAYERSTVQLKAYKSASSISRSPPSAQGNSNRPALASQLMLVLMLLAVVLPR
eukprot:5486-Heterococcus_DN1.PRE.1